jgi:ssDNA thymidine ADP-ribosyltransferase, DarT
MGSKGILPFAAGVPKGSVLEGVYWASSRRLCALSWVKPLSSVPRTPPGAPRPWDGDVAVYHITHIDNIGAMARDGALRCDSSCNVNGIRPVSIAYDNLKAKRARWKVDVAQGGTLADYVPFYYAPRSPMLYAIDGGYVPSYDGGQVEVAHLVCSAQEIARPSGFAITNGHAISPLSDQFDDLACLDRIDWEIMPERLWRDTDEDGDRKRRRQAEFLVFETVAFEAVKQIGVLTKTVADRVRESLAGAAHRPPVIVRPDWYY